MSCLHISIVICFLAVVVYYIIWYISTSEGCARISTNFTGLAESLQRHVYGQYLVEEVVMKALRAHWGRAYKPKKALTLSFHGWPGSGKNYVTRFIAESMFTKGTRSKYFHHFVGRLHFPRDDKVAQYQSDLQIWIKGNVSNCPRQICIFDEMEKMPVNLLNAIKPMIDYHDHINNIDYRECVFIFLSNTGAELINEHYMLLLEQGKQREDLELNDFEALIIQGAFNIKGGFYHSDTIKSTLIDHYIPFLPMEKIHVKLCIMDEFRRRNVYPTRKEIEEVMRNMEWGSTNLSLFSTTGCKRISQYVGLVVGRYKGSEYPEKTGHGFK